MDPPCPSTSPQGGQGHKSSRRLRGRARAAVAPFQPPPDIEAPSRDSRGSWRRWGDRAHGSFQRSRARAAFLARPFAPKDNPDADLERRERRFSASCDGFDVHCAVRIAADDDQGRERLVRYCARPAFALSRIELLPDGRIAYLLKTPRRGRTHRIMSPMEFRRGWRL